MGHVISNSSNVSVLGLIILVVMCALTLRLKREHAIFPLLFTTCYIPLGQQFVIAGLNLQFFRVLLFVGFCRVWARGESRQFRLTKLDKWFIVWAAATVVMGTLADVSMDRFVNRAGTTLNAAVVYYLVRCWLRNLDEIWGTVRFLCLMILPLAASMILEKITGRNYFSVFGGVPEFTGIREGKLRCQGAFRHPILAGTYGVTCFPLFVGLWFLAGKKKWPVVAGIIGSLVVTVAAGSSGALLALVCGILGFAAWRYRGRLHWFRRGVVVALIVLHLAMKAPVWFLIGRLSEIVGGTGWYRSYIIDQAITHLNEWWLVGSTYTKHWAPAGEVVAGDPNNMDIINNYVAEGLGGGFLKLGAFIAMIVLGFKVVGHWAGKPESAVPLPWRVFIWGLGVCLLTHCISFFSVSYFDQIVVMWYWLLAVFSTLSISRNVVIFPRAESVGRG